MSDRVVAEQEKLELLSEEGYSSRKPQGVFKTIFYAIGISMAVFHIYFLGYSTMEPWELYYFHLGFGLVLAYMLYPFSRRSMIRAESLRSSRCVILRM